jgi:DNA-binding MarR family transcriptional regulator
VSDELVPGLRYASRAQELWASVIAGFAAWEERMNGAAARVGLSPASTWALIQLDPDDPISQKELAARLRCNPSTVVDSTDRLEEAGLVDRRAGRADRRVNTLVLTARGRQVRERLIAELFEPPDAFRRLPAGELARFQAAMVEVAARPEPAKDSTSGARKPTRKPAGRA